MRLSTLCRGMCALVLGLSLTGCSSEKEPTLLCTTTVVADVVRQVAGQHQTVGVLMGAGVDPHLYDPAPRDARRLNQAKVIFYSGLHLEGKMDDLLKSLGERKPVVALTRGLKHEELIADEDNPKLHDPHVWFDARLWAQTADVVAEELAKFDPPHAADYQANAAAYKKKLLALHEEVKKEIASIPEKGRVLATAHDAFHYFSRVYGIQVKAIQGVSTESEAGVREIENLVKFLTDRKIKAVFVESSVSDKNVRALQEGCKQAGHNIVIGGELYSDSLAGPNEPAGTYEGMMRHNYQTIVRALK